MEKLIRRSKFKPTWMAAGAITGGLLAYNPRYGIAFFVLTATLWLSYMYALHKGETQMHCRMSTLIREQVLMRFREINLNER